jgi:hypothetical protein
MWLFLPLVARCGDVQVLTSMYFLSLGKSTGQDRTGQVQYLKDKHFLVNPFQAHIQARCGKWRAWNSRCVVLRTPPRIDLRTGFGSLSTNSERARSQISVVGPLASFPVSREGVIKSWLTGKPYWRACHYHSRGNAGL